MVTLILNVVKSFLKTLTADLNTLELHGTRIKNEILRITDYFHVTGLYFHVDLNKLGKKHSVTKRFILSRLNHLFMSVYFPHNNKFCKETNK